MNGRERDAKLWKTERKRTFWPACLLLLLYSLSLLYYIKNTTLFIQQNRRNVREKEKRRTEQRDKDKWETHLCYYYKYYSIVCCSCSAIGYSIRGSVESWVLSIRLRLIRLKHNFMMVVKFYEITFCTMSSPKSDFHFHVVRLGTYLNYWLI